MKINIEIVDQINTKDVYEKLSHIDCGGICVFIGNVRGTSGNVPVEKLFFESYDQMAIKEMKIIAKEALNKWNLQKIIMRHVRGSKKVNEPVVLVGASSAHRNECFEACRFLIDSLKKSVPIWKKEFFKNKTIWVASHP